MGLLRQEDPLLSGIGDGWGKGQVGWAGRLLEEQGERAKIVLPKLFPITFFNSRLPYRKKDYNEHMNLLKRVKAVSTKSCSALPLLFRSGYSTISSPHYQGI